MSAAALAEPKPAPTPGLAWDASAVFAAMPMAALLIDARLRVVRANDAFCHDFPELVVDDDVAVHTLFEAESVLRIVKVCHDQHPGARATDITNCKLVTQAGSTLPVDLRVTALPGGLMLGFERRGTILADDFQLMREAIEHSPMPWTLQSSDYRLVVVNDAYCAMTGYSRDELVGRDPIELQSEETHEEIRRVRAMKSADLIGSPAASADTVRELIHKNGKRVPYRLVVGHTRDNQQRPYLFGFVIDLSSEQRLRERVRRHHDWISDVFEQAPVGMLLHASDGSIIANSMAHQLTGEQDDKEIAELLRAGEVVEPLSSAGAGKAAVSVPSTGDFEGGNSTIVKAATVDGTRWFERRQVLIERLRSSRKELLTVFTDVTRERELRATVQSALLQQSAILRCVSAGLAHVVGEVVIQVNREMLRFIGLPEQRIIGQPIETLFEGSVDWTPILQRFDPQQPTAEPYRLTVALNEAGQTRWHGVLTVQWVEPGRPDLGWLVTFADMTELFQHSAELEASVEQLRGLIDAQPVGVAELSNGRVVRANAMLSQLLDKPADALVGEPLDQYLQDPGPVADAVAALTNPSGELRDGETVLHVRLRAADGFRDALLLLTRVSNGAETMAIIVDVSEHRALADRAARDSVRFEAIARLTDDVLMIVEDEIVQFANPAMLTLTGLSEHDVVGRPLGGHRNVLDEQDHGAVRMAYDSLMAAGGGNSNLIVGVPHANLGHRSIRVRLFADPRISNECFIFGEDVTEHLRLERQRLEEALAQRDLLVREVHHRIKNNLQGVAGLLQQIGVHHPEVADWLNDASHQIRAIARIHGLEVRHGETIGLRRFLDAVVNAPLIPDTTQGVPLDYNEGVDTHKWGLPQMEAVPMALVLNELITNAQRHGVSDSVHLQVRGDSSGVQIQILSEGELPEGFSFDSVAVGATGLGLVKALLPRRGARLSFDVFERELSVSLALTSPAIRKGEGSASRTNAYGVVHT